MPVRERVQVQDQVETPILKPAGVPDSTYVRPPENALSRISQSLGELRPALQSFGEAYIAKQQKTEGEANRSQALIKSPTEWAERVKSIGPKPLGSLPETSAEAIESKLHGQQQAQELALSIQEKAAKGEIDWKTTDVNQLISSAMQEKSKEFAHNGYALSGFTQALEGFPAKLVQQRFKQVTEEDTAQRQDATYAALATTYKQAAIDGKPSQERADAVFQALNATSGPNGSLKVDFATANKYALDLARNIAHERPDDAVAILEHPRGKTADGVELPPLRDTAQHRGEIDGIMNTALAARRKQADLAAKQAIVQHDAGTMVDEGSKLATLQDLTIRKADGTTETITAKSRQTEAVREYVQNTSPRIARERHETPAQTFNREFSNFANAGLDHPQWKAILDAAPKAASLNELTTPAKRDDLLRAANLYDQLREKNPQYLKGLTDSGTRDFFETFRVAKTLPHVKSMEEAADLARRATIDITGDQENLLKDQYKEIANKVSSATPSSGFFDWTSAANGGTVQQGIIDRAKLFVRLGIKSDAAVEEAVKSYKETNVKVNGWVMPAIKGLPADFPDRASKYMQDFIKQHGSLNEGISASDVGMAYDGAGTFTLVRRNGGGLLKDGAVAHFTLKDLYEHAATQDDKIKQDLLDAGTKKQESRASAKQARDARLQGIRQQFEDATSAYINYRHLLGRTAPRN